MNDATRAPRAFVLDAAEKPVKHGAKTRKPRAITGIEFASEETPGDLATLPDTGSRTPARGMRWGTLLVSAVFGLVAMWAGLAVTQLVENFFARSPWLGWTAFGVATLAATAIVAIIIREIWGLARLNRIEGLQEKAARAINLDENESAKGTIAELEALYAGRADLAWGLKQLASHRTDIIDPSDRVRLAERLLVKPLDEQAHKIIARRARRVTLLTTVTPAAAFDILFVAAQNLAMLRELATLYGGRPSALSTLKLARMVITHLAVTGGLALSDNLIQHLVGKGLLGRLSARFGEGAVNGILTSRIGLAALDVCRPIPNTSSNRETLASLLREVIGFGEKDQPGAESKSQS